jgi:hypothetical protein
MELSVWQLKLIRASSDFSTRINGIGSLKCLLRLQKLAGWGSNAQNHSTRESRPRDRQMMSSRLPIAKTVLPPRPAAKGIAIGRLAFAKISAIEGIHLSAEMVHDFREFDHKGPTATERRKAIERKYGAVRS